MLPTYRHGDHVLTFNYKEIKIDDVVVFRHDDVYLIKRVVGISGKKVKLEGDNKAKSKTYENVPVANVCGVVFWKY